MKTIEQWRDEWCETMPERAVSQLDAILDAMDARGDVQGEYICKCGVRVEPHRCATGTDF